MDYNTERKKLPIALKEAVRFRQNNRCAVCLNMGRHFHHIVAVGIDDTQQRNYQNIMMLCEDHHLLFHQGDPETYESIYEYAWYIQNGKMPHNIDLSTISQDVHEKIRGSHLPLEMEDDSHNQENLQ